MITSACRLLAHVQPPKTPLSSYLPQLSSHEIIYTVPLTLARVYTARWEEKHGSIRDGIVGCDRCRRRATLGARLVGCEQLDQALESQEAIDWIPRLYPKCGPHAH
jgi:hypothetical protein